MLPLLSFVVVNDYYCFCTSTIIFDCLFLRLTPFIETVTNTNGCFSVFILLFSSLKLFQLSLFTTAAIVSALIVTITPQSLKKIILRLFCDFFLNLKIIIK